MVMIISKVKEIDNLYIKKLPTGRLVSIEKAIRVSGITLLLGKNGQLYCDQIKDYAYTPGNYRWVEPLTKALIKLKILTKEQVDEHIDHCKQVEHNKSARYDKKLLEDLSKKYRFDITDNQINSFE